MSCCVWFFFFKQKTAYEMRISDWSSDVCSSDLQYDEENLVGQRMLDRFEARFGYRPQNFWSVLNYDFANIIAHGLSMAHPLSPEEIGRASCRERVCQYV